MATLAELSAIHARGSNEAEALVDKIKAAVLLAAEVIRLESTGTASHAQRALWAKEAFSNPTAKANEMLGAILAANSSATQAQILSASDSAIQTAVSNAVNTFITV